jgi:hypothetical protein
MNLLQQLSEINLTKQEIEAVIEVCDHAVETYNENLESLDKVIALYEKSNDVGVIKMIIEKDDGFETKSQSLEEVKAYRMQLVDDNQKTIDLLASTSQKLHELTKIFTA